ncbi:MAG: TIGR03032 family protein [Bacteroidales bacterium]|nr:MAG: TIGR03032 family protein [Bacteroidales bacterium]
MFYNFASTYTPNVPELLYTLKCTIALSTYQACKVIFISAAGKDKLIQLPRTFDNAMGIARDDDKLAIACKNEVIVLRNSSGLAKHYPSKPNTYDALYLPRALYYTGQLSLHDMNYVNNKLTAINTLFSCISVIDEQYSFKTIWKPGFIDALAPEDRCHLNGMAVTGEKIEFVTALGNTNTKQGWRENKLTGGVIIHLPTGEIVLNGLAMPHSPRVYDNNLYFLQSARGELMKADLKNNKHEVITRLNSFARGMAKAGDYLFIGVSKLRHTDSVFADLPIAGSSFAGIIIVHLPLAKIVGHIRYEANVEEIYDVKIIQGFRRPNILNPGKTEHRMALVNETDTYWAKEEED